MGNESFTHHPTIIQGLRIVARMHFDGEIPDYEYNAGLCFALREVGVRNAYVLLDDILKQDLGFSYAGYLGNNAPDGVRENWNDRAFFALFLAEYLETKALHPNRI
jgi:hypothetical protein